MSIIPAGSLHATIRTQTSGASENSNGTTPSAMFAALKQGDTAELTRQLKDAKKEDLITKNGAGNTLLHEAIDGRNNEAIRAIMNKIDTLSAADMDEVLSAANSDGHTARYLQTNATMMRNL